MTTKIDALKGMTEELTKELTGRGISTATELLELVTTPAQRKSLADSAGVAQDVVREIANRADLSRVKGVSGVFSDLLEHAGVDTVKELATRRADNLHAKIKEVNDSLNLAGRIPTLADVENWVEQAKKLPKTLTY